MFFFLRNRKANKIAPLPQTITTWFDLAHFWGTQLNEMAAVQSLLPLTQPEITLLWKASPAVVWRLSAARGGMWRDVSGCTHTHRKEFGFRAHEGDCHYSCQGISAMTWCIWGWDSPRPPPGPLKCVQCGTEHNQRVITQVSLSKGGVGLGGSWMRLCSRAWVLSAVGCIPGRIQRGFLGGAPPGIRPGVTDGSVPGWLKKQNQEAAENSPSLSKCWDALIDHCSCSLVFERITSW